MPGGARHHVDAIGDEVGTVEAHPELTDERQILAVALGLELREKRLGPRPRHRSQIAHQLVVRHPRAAVLQREGSLLLVGDDGNLQRDVAGQERRIGEGAEAQPVQRVRRVGDELAQEDLFVAVERVDDQVKHLRDVGLEGVRLGHGARCQELAAGACESMLARARARG